jgi:hypothetical protein
MINVLLGAVDGMDAGPVVLGHRGASREAL